MKKKIRNTHITGITHQTYLQEKGDWERHTEEGLCFYSVPLCVYITHVIYKYSQCYLSNEIF